MTGEQHDIEQIVREVIRRLAETLDRAPNKAAAAEKPPIRETPAARSPQEMGRLELRERVVTTASLERRLDGVRQVVVPARAVVTPAVRDMLRKRRIALVDRTEPVEDAACERGPLLAVVDPTGQFGGAAAAVAAELGDVERWDGDCVVKAVRQVGDAVADGRRAGIVFTCQPSLAICQGNRRAGVRAAWGVNVAAVKEAVLSIGANVLVVNPTLHSVFELRGILREFAGGNHVCPKRYLEALET